MKILRILIGKYLVNQKTISGLTCQLAKTNFRGRSYEVWFTNKIPTFAGPWKFHGLPGLIIEISDSTKEVSIQLKNFRYVDQSYDKPNLESVKWWEMKDLVNCLDNRWKKIVEREKAIIAQSRAESPDLTITLTEAKRRPATELEFE